MTQQLNFAVTGEERIHCASCERRISNALRRLPGVEDVQASFRTQRMAVTFDPTGVSPEQIRARLEQLGYEVKQDGGAA